MQTTIPDIAVLVVGAGPTGLLLAAELCRRSVPCVLIDARSEAMHWDRATVVHPRSLQIFEAIGVVDKLLDVGCKQRVIKVYSDGTMLGAIDLSTSGSAYGFNLGLSEEVTESVLTDYLHRQGGLVTRGSRLAGFRPHADGVIASIDKDGKEYELTARWVVGCDGIHSATRLQTGIDFDGHKYVKQWAVFDAYVEGWNDTHEGIFAYQDLLPIILTALPNKRWRVYVRPSSEDSDLVAEATSTLRMYTPSASFVDVENATRFNCYTKIAARFRSGPAFLAGDSAHLCSPSEGHGMNTGIQDAFNLAWKLALVYHGAASESLLDTYEAERRPIAEVITRSGDVSEESQIMTDPTEREKRNQAIRAFLSDPEELHRQVMAETELVIDYTGSPIIMGDASDFLSAGFRLPDTIAVEHPEGRGWRYLHQLAHRPGHTLLLLAGAEANEAELLGLHSAIRDLAAHSPIFESAFTVATYTGLSDEIGECSPSTAGQLGIHGITLLAMRPDGYVGARADRNHLAAIESYRNLILAGSVKVAETPVAAEQARR
jgi:2-polyprenyl-6-methoxyphenol hydroxylase-like FAD-dependent oxidoreductase